jgi:hypothetical protein
MNHNIEHHDDLHIERFADRGEASSTSRKDDDDDDDANGRTRRWHSCRACNHNVDLKDSGEEKESEG